MSELKEETGLLEELAEELELPELVAGAVRWMGRHPGAFLTGALVAGALAVVLVQSLPHSTKADNFADEQENPLFI